MAKVKRTQCIDLGKILKNLEGKKARVGFFEASKYEDGTPVAYVASIQEYGYAPKNIPPRPFMRTTMDTRQKEWGKQAESGAKAILAGNSDMNTVLSAIAAGAAGDIQKTISKIFTPALKDSTIRARERRYADGGKRGSSPNKPLVDTGLLLSSVSWNLE